eukprot:m.49648 g.49648  ORF g.49648 m.49648 type:complete len:389 (+) comp6489_c0_seq1:243-1409(+)
MPPCVARGSRASRLRQREGNNDDGLLGTESQQQQLLKRNVLALVKLCAVLCDGPQKLGIFALGHSTNRRRRCPATRVDKRKVRDFAREVVARVWLLRTLPDLRLAHHKHVALHTNDAAVGVHWGGIVRDGIVLDKPRVLVLAQVGKNHAIALRRRPHAFVQVVNDKCLVVDFFERLKALKRGLPLVADGNVEKVRAHLLGGEALDHMEGLETVTKHATLLGIATIHLHLAILVNLHPARVGILLGKLEALRNIALQLLAVGVLGTRSARRVVELLLKHGILLIERVEACFECIEELILLECRIWALFEVRPAQIAQCLVQLWFGALALEHSLNALPAIDSTLQLAMPLLLASVEDAKSGLAGLGHGKHACARGKAVLHELLRLRVCAI